MRIGLGTVNEICEVGLGQAKIYGHVLKPPASEVALVLILTVCATCFLTRTSDSRKRRLESELL